MKWVKTWTWFLVHNESKIIKPVKCWIYEHYSPSSTAVCAGWWAATGPSIGAECCKSDVTPLCYHRHRCSHFLKQSYCRFHTVFAHLCQLSQAVTVCGSDHRKGRRRTISLNFKDTHQRGKSLLYIHNSQRSSSQKNDANLKRCVT